MLIGMAVGAAIGAGVGGLIGGVTSKMSGGNFWDGAADGWMVGSISGAISGGVSGSGVGLLGAVTADGLLDSGVYTYEAFKNGEQVTAAGLATSFAVGAGFSFLGTKASGFITKQVAAKSAVSQVDDVVEGVGKIASRRAFRVLDEVADAAIVNRVKSIRSLLPSDLKKGGNLAIADVEIPGIKSQFYAHNDIDVLADARSAADKVSDISLKSTNPKLKFSKELTSDGRFTDRDIDSEFKILNDLASKLGGNTEVKGKIRLFTELEPCQSCENAIDEFLDIYKNLTIEIVHNNKTRLIP